MKEIFFLEYQYLVKEPEYSTFYSNTFYTERTGDVHDIGGSFIPKTFYGRTNTLKFKLCHDYCM